MNDRIYVLYVVLNPHLSKEATYIGSYPKKFLAEAAAYKHDNTLRGYYIVEYLPDPASAPINLGSVDRRGR